MIVSILGVCKCFQTVGAKRRLVIYIVFQNLVGGHYLCLVEKKTLEREGLDPLKTSDPSVLSNLK